MAAQKRSSLASTLAADGKKFPVFCGHLKEGRVRVVTLTLNGRKPFAEVIGDDDEDGGDDEQSRDLFFIYIVEHRCYFSAATLISLSPGALIKATDSFEA
jgi:hypothetical protein